MSMTEIGSQTPTPTEIIREAIRQNQLELNTMLPGKVTFYDEETQTCSVLPLLKRTTIDPPSIDSRPILNDVPVIFPRVKAGGSYFPLEQGDGVMIIFCQRSLDDWRELGVEDIVNDTRLHDIADPVVVPGMFSLVDKLVDPKAGYTIDFQKIWIGDSTGSGAPLSGLTESELFQAMSKVIDQLLSKPLIVTGATANFDPTVIAALGEIKTMLDGFKP